MPNRRKEIPKDGGKKVRVLGIPSIRDRVVQGALLLILEPIFEADFQAGSFGYRPGRTTHEAVDRVEPAIKRGKTRVIDVDLRAYFDNVRHHILLAKLAARIDDRGQDDGRAGQSTATTARVQTGTNMGLGFAEGAFDVFRTTMFLPNDYSADTDLTARFLFSIAETGCAVDWTTNTPLRLLFDGGGTTNALTVTPASADVAVPATSGNIFSAIGTLSSTDILPGDLITLSWYRGTTGDTCTGTLVLSGVQLIYE